MRKWWWTAAAVVLAASGCAVGESRATGSTVGEPRDVEIDSVPFLDGATLGPGAELRDGITVVEGSHVLGDTMPLRFSTTLDGPDVEQGWTALAVVTGNARRVLDAYAAQASEVGLPVPTVSCFDVPADATGPGGIACTAVSRSDDRTREFRLDFVRSTGDADRPPRSHVWVAVRNRTEPPTYDEVPVGDLPPGIDPGPGSDLPWGELPAVGEPYEPPVGGPTPTAFVVQEGTRLVGPPALEWQGQVNGSTLAVLRVDGDVDQVVDRYRTAFGPAYEHHTSSEEEGVQVDRWYWTNGDTATVDVYRRDGRPTFIAVWHTAGD